MGYRIGADGVIELIPGLGYTVGAFLSNYIVLEAAKLSVSRSVLLRMIFNIAIETIVGVIPVAGDLFDLGWKANQKNVLLKNVLLLDAYLNDPGRVQTQSRTFLAVVVLGVIAFIMLTL